MAEPKSPSATLYERLGGYHAIAGLIEDLYRRMLEDPQIGNFWKGHSTDSRVRELRSFVDFVCQATGAPAIYRVLDVTGITKGKGFAGVMKRHGFGGKEASHGTERKHRSAGSIGGHAPGALGRGVKKGKRMAGHMGDVRCTVRAIELLKVDAEHGLLLLRGSVPGPAGGTLWIRMSNKVQG